MKSREILDNLCEAIVDCEHKTAPIQSWGIPSIRTTNIKNGRIDFQNANRVSEETYQKWTARLEPKQGDLILAREAPVGEVGIIPPNQKACLGQRTVLIRPDNSQLNSHYLLYLLLAPEMRHEMLCRAEGSTVSHLNMSDIRGLLIPSLPPLPEQKAIARILGTLDDKIELNQKMNQTLEAMARAIFKSWFVDFDPVTAKMVGRQPTGMDAATAALFPDSFQDSPLGLIPKGWEVKPLPEVIEVNPTRRLSKGQVAPYLEMKSMPTQGHRSDTWINRPFASGTKFINGDTLMARITPCLENGKTAFVDFLEDGQVGWGSTEYLIFRPKHPLPLEFGYYLSRSDELKMFAIQNMTGSSGRQRTPANSFWQYLMPIPPTEITTKYGNLVKTYMKKITGNSNQSRTLSTLRDSLLPRLMSGKIRVAEAERQIEKAM
ncbi:restriction endonuclease subunit S [Oscillatoriales cyanobacterium LEGE 11467]|uniref:Restriction endonuclease subunit S n=1 Tax=Zarconia navalis LEGE 11467 TaxID=1828826 RepID=A0A928VWU9_9CYAN|nr:restriction endonuclease subunit S [Zarconia navalis]MBE9041779.1 restriction endonuclease subunit S [Zarconia navalis LEGE 11467]